MLVDHAVVHRLWQSLEDVADFKRYGDTHRFVNTGDAHKPVAVLLIWRGVLVGFVVLHHGGVHHGGSG